MKNKTCIATSALVILILASLNGTLLAQQAAGPLAELKAAAEAVKEGSESRAWQLYSQNSATFQQRWKELDPEFVAWVADQYRRQKRFREATALCNGILAVEDKVPASLAAQAILIKGDIFRDQQNYAAARMEYQSLERHKTFKDTAAGRDARFRIVDILRVTRDYEGAEELLERLKDFPDPETQAEAYYFSARLAFDQEALDLTREFIEEVKKRVPNHVETLFLEAELNLKEDRLQDPELEIGSKVLTTYVIPGRPLTMKMQDRNLAVVRGGAGIPVVVQTSQGNDAEMVSLLPSPRDPTLFRGSLNTTLGSVTTNNIKLEVSGSDIVTYKILERFQKANDLEYPPKQMLVVADAELLATSGDFVAPEDRDKELLRQRVLAAMRERDETVPAYERRRNTNVVRPGNDIRIQVIDFDRDVSPDLDQVFVTAATSSGDSVEGIELVETEPHSGMFRGSVPTYNAPPRASAASTAPGKSAGSPVTTGDGRAWASDPAANTSVWYEVDLMTMHPIRTVELDLAAQSSLKHVTLLTAPDDELRELASTQPSESTVYGYLDLSRYFGRQARTAAYIYTEVTSDQPRDVTLKIGSCDGVACWVNGERVHLNLGGRVWQPEQDVVQAKLKAGPNAILMKITQLTGPWGASLTVLDAAGNPLPSMPVTAPAAPGVVTEWYVFDRLTPEEIQVAERIDVKKPVRVLGKPVPWVKVDVSPAASIEIDGGTLKTVLHRPLGLRKLRWVFDEFAGKSIGVQEVRVVNTFGDAVVPAPVEFSSAATNRLLELGPGDSIDITYDDERSVRSDKLLSVRMSSGFHNASVLLAYETITLTDEGEREIVYDPAVRYRAGETERLAVRVVDFDADVSEDADKVKVLITTSGGETLWLEALETEVHSGEFLSVLNLGNQTAGNTIAVGEGVTLTVSYSDRENSDGRIERVHTVREASDEPPELLLYQAMVMADEAGLLETEGGVISRVQLPRRAPGQENEPVVTSLDTGLVFRAVYPMAAISSNATYTAYLATARELAAASGEGREPDFLEAPMRLVDPALAEFETVVPLRIGDPSTYVIDIEDERLMADDDEEIIPYLYVNGDDVVHVRIKSLDGNVTREGTYRLASDAFLQFTDETYEEASSRIYLGDFVYVRVRDRDRDVSDELDSIAVTLSTKTAEKEVTLTETLPHSGEFTGRVKTEPLTESQEAAAPEAESMESDAFRLSYSDRIEVAYNDEVSVVSDGPRKLTKTLAVNPGADGALAIFTKLFSDKEIAVKTQLLTAEALFELAKEHRKMEQTELAEEEIAEGKRILEEAIADYPNTKHAPHAEFLLANLAQELEKYEEALERYNRVLSNWPDSEHAPRAQLKKAICLEKLEDYDNALDAYVELTYAYPNSPLVSDAVVRLGQYFYRTKEYAVAGNIFGSFHDNNSENPLAPKALFLSGQSYMKGAEERKQLLEGRYDKDSEEWLGQAVERFDQLIATYDDKDLRAEAMYWLADCYMKTDDMKNAYLTLKRLTWDYPESKWAKFARGQLVQNAAAFDRIKED